jgi:hypothetical protein
MVFEATGNKRQIYIRVACMECGPIFTRINNKMKKVHVDKSETEKYLLVEIPVDAEIQFINKCGCLRISFDNGRQ